MKLLGILSVSILFFACSYSKTAKSKNYNSAIIYYRDCDSGKKFNYLPTLDTFQLKVNYFLGNMTYCFTECIPYALIIGEVIDNSKLPKKVAVLARCDQNIYSIDQRLLVRAVKNPILETTLRPCYFVKDTIINDQKCSWLEGSEYPAVWGKILK